MAPGVRPLPPSAAHINDNSWQLWYDTVIDWMIANPGSTLQQVAAGVQRNYAYLTLIVRSDSFQTRLAERRRHFEAELNRGVAQKLTRVTASALDEIQKRLDKGANVPMKVLTELADTGLKALGYGNPKLPAAAPGSAVSVAVTIGVTPSALATARANVQQLEGRVQPAAPAAQPRTMLEAPSRRAELPTTEGVADDVGASYAQEA